MYSVKATGERFRSFDADNKIAYQELLEKKLVEQFLQTVLVVIFFWLKIINIFSQDTVLCVAMTLGDK